MQGAGVDFKTFERQHVQIHKWYKYLVIKEDDETRVEVEVEEQEGMRTRSTIVISSFYQPHLHCDSRFTIHEAKAEIIQGCSCRKKPFAFVSLSSLSSLVELVMGCAALMLARANGKAKE